MKLGNYKLKLEYWEDFGKANINRTLLEEVIDAKNGKFKPKPKPQSILIRFLNAWRN